MGTHGSGRGRPKISFRRMYQLASLKYTFELKAGFYFGTHFNRFTSMTFLYLLCYQLIAYTYNIQEFFASCGLPCGKWPIFLFTLCLFDAPVKPQPWGEATPPPPVSYGPVYTTYVFIYENKLFCFNFNLLKNTFTSECITLL